MNRLFSSSSRPPWRFAGLLRAEPVVRAAAILLCSVALPLPVPAAASTGAKPALDRYLLVIETSPEMQRCAENMHRIVGNLAASGMNGQLREGETLGVWTFDETLHAGFFPLQRWTPQTRTRIATDMVAFLKRQSLAKKGRLDAVILPLKRLVADSEALTVVLITAGEDKLGGTPFDREINASYKLNSAAQRKARMPFVTVLRAWKGEVVGWRVNTPPWPIEFPAFPLRPPSEQLATPEEAPKAEPKPEVPPLIVVGKKPEPVAIPATNAPPVEEPKPEPPAPTVTVQTTPSEPKPVVQEPAVSPPTAPAEPPVATISATNPGLAQAPPISVPSEPAPAAIATPDPAKAEPQPVPVPATTESPAPPAPDPATRSGMETSAPVRVVLPPTAVVEPTGSFLNRNIILIAGVAVLLVALGLGFAFLRRARPAEKISLITRSMDRDKE